MHSPVHPPTGQMTSFSYSKWDHIVDSDDDEPIVKAAPAPAVRAASAVTSSTRTRVTIDVVSDPN